MNELNLFLGDANTVSFNPTESFNLSVKPSVQMRNPLTADGELVKVIGQTHQYKMLHLNTPKDVLQPQVACSTWNPQTRTYMDYNEVTCGYFEVMEEFCGDEFYTQAMYNLTSKRRADVEALMVLSDQPISQIVGALIVELQKAIGSSTYLVSQFGDLLFGDAGYHSLANLNLGKHHSQDQITNLKKMMQKIEGFWTILRRRAGNKQISFADSNDGTASGNATLPANITGFFQDMVNLSKPVLKYAREQLQVAPVLEVQDGLFNAYKKYLTTLPGGEAAHRYIVEGLPVKDAYWWDDYVVYRNSSWDVWDYKIGVWDDATGKSLNQRAVFTIPGNKCLVTNVRPRPNTEAGLQVQQSPLIRDKGRVDMFMTLGVGAGIAHNDLITAGFNTSKTYATS